MTERKANLKAKLKEVEAEIALALKQGTLIDPTLWKATLHDANGKAYIAVMTVTVIG